MRYYGQVLVSTFRHPTKLGKVRELIIAFFLRKVQNPAKNARDLNRVPPLNISRIIRVPALGVPDSNYKMDPLLNISGMTNQKQFLRYVRG